MNRDLKQALEFIADTGAIQAVIPQSVAEKLQLKETDRRRLKTASGEFVGYPVSEGSVIIGGKGVTSLLPSADGKTPVLLDVTTLELLGLQVESVNGKLTRLELMIL